MKYSKRKVKRVRPILGTYVEIALQGRASDEKLNSWITSAFQAVEEIDRLMSFYRPDSDLSRLNRAAPSVWVTIHPHTLKVLQAANEFYETSEGNFDIRCGAYPHPPREKVAGGRMRAPLVLSRRRARKTGPWTLDLGGIAKGYAVDCAVDKIKELSHGYHISGMVNAGGDLRRWGKGRAPIAVATSAVRMPGQGARLSPAVHVLMPEGRAIAEQKAVTVLADRCLWSDALTKILLLAPEKISAHCLKRYDAHGLLLA